MQFNSVGVRGSGRAFPCVLERVVVPVVPLRIVSLVARPVTTQDIGLEEVFFLEQR